MSHVTGIEEYECVDSKTDPSDPFSMDTLVLRVVCATAARNFLAETLPETIRCAVEVTPRLEFVARD